MVTEGRHPGDGSDDERRRPDDSQTEPIPPVDDHGDVESGEVFEFDDVEYAAIVASRGAGAELDFEPVDIITQREPSDLARRYLFPTEKFRGEWRRHWVHLAKRLAIGVLATFVLGYASGFVARQQVPTALTIIVIIWIAVMGWVLWDVAEWYYDRFVLTNKRVMLIGGIVARRVAMMPLARVTDMKYTQSPVGRILGYGTFEIESAGQEQALRTVKNLPNPTDVYLQVVEEMYEPDASEARRRPAPVDDA